MHRQDEVLDQNDIKGIGEGTGLERNRGWGVQPTHQTGVSVGIITKERAPGCGQPGISVQVLRTDISHHQHVESSTETPGQVLMKGRVGER